MSPLEKRVAELERKLEAMERRRAKLIPPELENDPNVIELCADHVKSAVQGWRQCLQEHGVSLAQAKFLEAQRQALRELEQQALEKKERETAELCAVLLYIEKHGVAPAGYELMVEDFENPPTNLHRWELPAGEPKQ